MKIIDSIVSLIICILLLPIVMVFYLITIGFSTIFGSSDIKDNYYRRF